MIARSRFSQRQPLQSAGCIACGVRSTYAAPADLGQLDGPGHARLEDGGRGAGGWLPGRWLLIAGAVSHAGGILLTIGPCWVAMLR